MTTSIVFLNKPFGLFVPGVGLEPTRPFDPKILSLVRLPLRHPGKIFESLTFVSLLRPGAELNRRIKILQIFALPLGYQADTIY